MATIDDLLAEFPALAEAVNQAVIVDERGEWPSGGWLPEYRELLAPALQNEGDLASLVAVLADAQVTASARGGYIASSTLQRFVEVQAHQDLLLAQLTADAPNLHRLLAQDRPQAVRLLCLGDEWVQDALHTQAAMLDPLLATAESLLAFTDMLARAAGCRLVNVADMMAVLPVVGQIIGASSPMEVFACMHELMVDGQYLHGMNGEIWLANLQKVAATLPAGIEKRMVWLAKLNGFADLLPPQTSWIATAEDARRVHSAFSKITEISYGHSDRDADMKACLPGLFQSTAHLVSSLDDFLWLCQAMPDLLRSLPEESEERMYGYVHFYDSSQLEERARGSANLGQFLELCGLAPKATQPERFEWPQFGDKILVDARRSWTAMFDSYDQRNEDCYYLVTLYDRDAAVSRFMAQIDLGWAGDDWTAPEFKERVAEEIAAVAASGHTNTGYAGGLPGWLAG